MLETIKEIIVQSLIDILIGFIEPIYAVCDYFLRVFYETGRLHDMLSVPFVEYFITGAQAIAGAVLACRLAWEALQMASLRSEGAVTDPGGLLKRTVASVIAIAGGPFVVKQCIILSNLLAGWVANTGVGVNIEQLNMSELASSVASGSLYGTTGFVTGVIFWPVVFLVIAIIIFLVFMQAVIRTIEITLSAILAPFMAVGWMSGGGTAITWMREVGVITVSHAIQMLLLYMSIAFLVGALPTGFLSQMVMRPFFCLGALWVAFKTPRILKNYAYSSGIRGAAGQAGNVAMWRAASRFIK
ncbi:MAG: hypothetical protein JG764_963 [Clostridiales bacterium]|nr:hypothetical protein [Clostridiales bacterium]